MPSSRITPIVGVIQKYAWGKLGGESEVAKLFKGAVSSFEVESCSPYAELWFGTHPKGTSIVINYGEPLNIWLSKNLEVNNGCVELPFLFKVLSVGTALSIQIHPNKVEAIKLHAQNPKEYPDNNHKPEMTIALTPFEALCGFRPLAEIQFYIQELEELQILIRNRSMISSSDDLKESFVSLMHCDANLVKEYSATLVKKIKKCEKLMSDTNHKLFCRLNGQYPGDVGCFCVYFLNHITLQPGQSLFLQSNLPHAYIQGDCIECMANSDNVIRAGLTPKFRDVETLCRLVEYTPKPPAEVLFEPMKHSIDQHITLYKPPVSEFAVEKIILPKNITSYKLPGVETSSILLVVCGCVDIHDNHGVCILKAHKGTSLFVGMRETVHFVHCLSNGDESGDVVMFRAFSQV